MSCAGESNKKYVRLSERIYMYRIWNDTERATIGSWYGLCSATKARSEASETDTQRDQHEALRMSERLRSPVGAETPNRELRDDVLDVILLPNGDPLGVHFWPRANFERFLSDFGTT